MKRWEEEEWLVFSGTRYNNLEQMLVIPFLSRDGKKKTQNINKVRDTR